MQKKIFLIILINYAFASINAQDKAELNLSASAIDEITKEYKISLEELKTIKQNLSQIGEPIEQYKALKLKHAPSFSKKLNFLIRIGKLRDKDEKSELVNNFESEYNTEIKYYKKRFYAAFFSSILTISYLIYAFGYKKNKNNNENLK